MKVYHGAGLFSKFFNRVTSANCTGVVGGFSGRAGVQRRTVRDVNRHQPPINYFSISADRA